MHAAVPVNSRQSMTRAPLPSPQLTSRLSRRMIRYLLATSATDAADRMQGNFAGAHREQRLLLARNPAQACGSRTSCPEGQRGCSDGAEGRTEHTSRMTTVDRRALLRGRVTPLVAEDRVGFPQVKHCCLLLCVDQ